MATARGHSRTPHAYASTNACACGGLGPTEDSVQAPAATYSAGEISRSPSMGHLCCTRWVDVRDDGGTCGRAQPLPGSHDQARNAYACGPSAVEF